MSRFAQLVFVCCLSLCATGWALEDAEIPTDPPQDEIMPAERQVQETLDWASLAFTGRRMGVEPAIRVEVKRQDHSVLQFGQSCIETPIRIGQQEFAHGLGTHANSEIVLHVPAGARAFEAFAGIDNNSDTGGARGTAQFSVEIAGRSVFQTPVLKGGQAPVAVHVDLPEGTREVTLKVDTTADGPGWIAANAGSARTPRGSACRRRAIRRPGVHRLGRTAP